jgi:hypothetical protein
MSHSYKIICPIHFLDLRSSPNKRTQTRYNYFNVLCCPKSARKYMYMGNETFTQIMAVKIGKIMCEENIIDCCI